MQGHICRVRRGSLAAACCRATLSASDCLGGGQGRTGPPLRHPAAASTRQAGESAAAGCAAVGGSLVMRSPAECAARGSCGQYMGPRGCWSVAVDPAPLCSTRRVYSFVSSTCHHCHLGRERARAATAAAVGRTGDSRIQMKPLGAASPGRTAEQWTRPEGCERHLVPRSPVVRVTRHCVISIMRQSVRPFIQCLVG